MIPNQLTQNFLQALYVVDISNRFDTVEHLIDVLVYFGLDQWFVVFKVNVLLVEGHHPICP